mmetsp:Transcript_32544/g.98122  ORF Transcript_32544/g.98122 Transcript_32544/m.98122 type:complete len:97 (+) Transcript_32544:413-703(+)
MSPLPTTGPRADDNACGARCRLSSSDKAAAGGFDAAAVPDSRTLPGMFDAGSAARKSARTKVKQIGSGTLAKSSTSDFQALMGAIPPGDGEEKLMV